jgi:hypothetical protein
MQIYQARGDLYAIADDLEFVQLARLPTRACLSRTLILSTASTWGSAWGAAAV